MSQDTVFTVLPSTGRTRFLDACYRRPPDATPVWFMRQAGRSFAEYRELRKKYGILEIAKTPELSTQVTLMPVHTFGVDGAVLYADIMLPLEGMGVSLEIEPEVGPIIDNPIRTMKDVEALRVLDAQETVPYVLETVRMVRRELAGKQAVIGFSGAPFREPKIVKYPIWYTPNTNSLEEKHGTDRGSERCVGGDSQATQRERKASVYGTHGQSAGSRWGKPS